MKFVLLAGSHSGGVGLDCCACVLYGMGICSQHRIGPFQHVPSLTNVETETAEAMSLKEIFRNDKLSVSIRHPVLFYASRGACDPALAGEKGWNGVRFVFVAHPGMVGLLMGGRRRRAGPMVLVPLNE